jgi:hypothetical protein
MSGPIKPALEMCFGDAMASDHGRETGAKRRRERLAASLRENLKRRKAQQRGRAAGNDGDAHHAAGAEALQEVPPLAADRGA